MDAMGIIIAVVGLVITLVVVGGVFFLLYRVFGGLKRANQERERLLREGVQASARVLSVQMGGMTMTVGVHRHLQLQIGLEVQPAGQPPYQTTLTTMISELQIPQIQPGVVLTVRFDPRDPSKVALAHEMHHRYPIDMQARNGVPEVLRTGNSELLEVIEDWMLVAGCKDAEQLRIARELRLRSALLVPLWVRGRVTGVLSWVSTDEQRLYDDATCASPSTSLAGPPPPSTTPSSTARPARRPSSCSTPCCPRPWWAPSSGT